MYGIRLIIKPTINEKQDFIKNKNFLISKYNKRGKIRPNTKLKCENFSWKINDDNSPIINKYKGADFNMF